MPLPTAPPVAITMGDPGGIGGEVVLRAWAAQRNSMPPFFVIDDPKRLSSIAEWLKLDCLIATIDDPIQTHNYFARALPVLPVDPPLKVPATLGVPQIENAPSVIGAINQAVTLTRAGKVSAFVTNPIHKASLQDAGFRYPGHTEYLGHLAGSGTQSVMMLVCDEADGEQDKKIMPGLRVVPITVHLALREVASTLTIETIVAHGKITTTALQKDFGIANPRLAVAALNPHGGEDGKFGTEETDIIAPAINALRSEGVDVAGPYPADTLFHAQARATFDAVLCMYHDQALIPLKTLNFFEGVNITLGLPFVRTSPDHGTAFDIAGCGVARYDSLVAAIHTAARIAAQRLKT